MHCDVRASLRGIHPVKESVGGSVVNLEQQSDSSRVRLTVERTLVQVLHENLQFQIVGSPLYLMFRGRVEADFGRAPFNLGIGRGGERLSRVENTEVTVHFEDILIVAILRAGHSRAGEVWQK